MLEAGDPTRKLRFGEGGDGDNVVVELGRLIPTLSLLDTGWAVLPRISSVFPGKMFWAWLKAEIEKRVVRLDTSGNLHFAPEAFGGRLHLARFEGAVLGLVLASQYAGARLKTGKVRRPDVFQHRRRVLMGGCLALSRSPTHCVCALHPREAVHRGARHVC